MLLYFIFLDEDIAHRVKVHKYKTNDEGDEEEVESERWADNEEAHSIRRKFTNKPIESNGNKFHELAGTNEAQIHMNSNFSVNEINEEEQDRRSQFKVIKEFEKTMEFVKNASNLKVMPSLLIEQPSNEVITLINIHFFLNIIIFKVQILNPKFFTVLANGLIFEIIRLKV